MSSQHLAIVIEDSKKPSEYDPLEFPLIGQPNKVTFNRVATVVEIDSKPKLATFRVIWRIFSTVFIFFFAVFVFIILLNAFVYFANYQQS